MSRYRYRDVTPPRFEGSACEREDPDLFFTPWKEATIDRLNREQQARLICADCPFLVRCGKHGLEHEDYGIWGALSERDRRALGGRGFHMPGPAPRKRSAVRNLAKAGVQPEAIAEFIEAGNRLKRAAERREEAA